MLDRLGGIYRDVIALLARGNRGLGFSGVGERATIPGMTPYSATKGAIKMFTQGLARELGARGITVNNVQPGPIDTDLNPASSEWAPALKSVVPLDRYGHVDEVAARSRGCPASQSRAKHLRRLLSKIHRSFPS